MILNCVFEIYSTTYFIILELKRDGPPPCIGICYTMKLEALKQREELTKHNEVLKEVRFHCIHHWLQSSTSIALLTFIDLVTYSKSFGIGRAILR